MDEEANWQSLAQSSMDNKRHLQIGAAIIQATKHHDLLTESNSNESLMPVTLILSFSWFAAGPYCRFLQGQVFSFFVALADRHLLNSNDIKQSAVCVLRSIKQNILKVQKLLC